MLKILSLYITKIFLKIFFTITLLLIFIIFISVFLNNLKLAGPNSYTYPILITSLYEVPNYFQIALPFIMVLIGLIFIRNLSINNEMDVIKSSGVNIWYICKILLPTILLIGLLIIFLITPVIGYLKNNFLLKIADLQITTIDNNFWIIDSQNNKKLIIKSNDAKIYDNTIHLSEVTVFQIISGKFNLRVDGSNAIITDNNFIIHNANLKDATTIFPQQVGTYTLKTNISAKNLQNLTLEPHMVSIWNMSRFIKNLNLLGLNADEFKVYFYNMLAYPFILFAMFILGVGLALRGEKRIHHFRLIVIGIICGFTLYFLTNMINAFGVSGLIPPFLTVFGKLGLILSLGTYLVLNNEGI